MDPLSTSLQRLSLEKDEKEEKKAEAPSGNLNFIQPAAAKAFRSQQTALPDQEAMLEMDLLHPCVKEEEGLVSLDEDSSVFDAFDEDALPTGQLILNSCIGELQGDFLRCEMTPEVAHRFYLQLFQQTQGSPALLLKMAKRFKKPDFQILDLAANACEQLAESAAEEVAKAKMLMQERAKKNEEIDGEALPQIQDKTALIEKSAEKIKKEKEILEKKWKKKIKKYFAKCGELLTVNDSTQTLKEFCILFRALRKLRPDSIAPFYPFLTLLANRIDENWLKEIISEAKKIDPFLTSALVVYFQRLTLTRDNSKVLKASAQKIFEILKEFYPQDLIIPTLITALNSESQKAAPNLHSIANGLNLSLMALAAQSPKQAIKELIKSKHRLVGFSIIHRYLALAWCLENDLKKAEKLMKRAFLLPDISSDQQSYEIASLVITILNKTFPKKEPIKTLQRKHHDPLRAFLKILQLSVKNIKDVEDFIKELELSLASNIQDLPTIYFAIQWLASQLASHPNLFEKKLLECLFELNSRLAYICYMQNPVDRWVKKHFKKVKNDEQHSSFVVSFPNVRFGFSLPELPLITFSNDLTLTMDSVYSLARVTLQQVYSITLSVMTNHAVKKIIHQDNYNLPAPNDPLLFLNVLQEGFSRDVQKFENRGVLFHTTLKYLREYLHLEQAKRPFVISKEILAWAKFYIFAVMPKLSLADKMEREIFDEFYPVDFKVEHFQQTLEVVKKLHSIKLKGHYVELSLRDFFLASLRLQSSKTVTMKEHENLYSLFQIAQQLFGPRFSESFGDWGKRLEKAEKCGPAASEFHLMEHVVVDDLESSGPVEFEGNLNPIDKKLLRFFLDYWMKFHEKTREKNEHISKGGDDEGEGINERNWHQRALGKWLSIVENNTPELYPDYIKLSDKEKSALSAVVKKKHEHAVIVKKLKEDCKSLNTIEAMASFMVVNAELDREVGFYHSLFVETEQEAFHLYQILMEVSIARLFKSALISGGMSGWKERDLGELSQMLLPHMEKLIGAFHGPEEHLSGNGPIQIHYNAGIVTSTLAVVNTHIYFNKKQ